MYNSVRVQNFRGLRDVTLEGLTRVNLVVGQNGVGKTALLEAVFLLAGLQLPDPLRAIETRRGLREPFRTWSLDEGLLESLFYGFNMADEVEVQGNGDVFTLASTREQGQLVPRLSWHLADGRGSTTIYDRDGNIGGFQSDPRALPSHRPVFLGTRALPALKDEADQFSTMVQEGKRPQVIDSLQVIEPRLQRLELLKMGEQVAVHADVGLARMVPLGLLGEGLQRLSSFVLATAEASGYMLLVDEIDTGLHYSILTDMWRVVSAAASEFNYQLFATTHSYECMTAAYEAFADNPEDFSMHRLERREDGSIVSKDFGHDMLGVALERGFEVR
ncbi:MAG: AAA family ATPase [Armatimonadia bacterium]